tara:strand:+ start:123 stop:473 length:351 start_codon:yes stop_codon:yes gene_type:complete
VNDDRQLALVIAELNNKIEILLEKQEEMAENVAKIKEAIYNPDQGIFSRLKDLENWREMSGERIGDKIERATITNGELRMATVEAAVAGTRKIQWMVVAAVITTITSLIIKLFILP